MQSPDKPLGSSFTPLCFGLTPTEQQNWKTRLISLQISWKLASHSIPTKHPITFSVSHSPKAANDCPPYQTRNTHGLLQANFLPRADLKTAINKGTGVIPVVKEHDKGRKDKMMPWLLLLLWSLFSSCVLFARAKQASTYCSGSHFNTKSFLCILMAFPIATAALHLSSLAWSNSPWL